jgi:hypothetical protein
MTNPADLFQKLANDRRNRSEIPADLSLTESASPSEPNKRGRPATGKRSDPDWIGRTYYIRKDTDLDAEGELYALKRQGIDLDKSELVNSLLAAWVKWRQGENIDIQLSEISPRQKDKK